MMLPRRDMESGSTVTTATCSLCPMADREIDDADLRFAENFRDRRQREGLSQKAVAERMSDMTGAPYHQQTVARIEAGQQAARLGEAELLARAVGTTSGALLLPAGLAREATRLVYAVREARAAYRALTDGAERLAKAREALKYAIEAGEKAGEDRLADQLSIARIAMRETT